MKERAGFHHTKKRFLSNYKVVGAVTFIPLWYNLDMFTYNRLEGTTIGLLALPITLIITPIMLIGSMLAVSANTVWGFGALPMAAIRDYFNPDIEVNKTIEKELSVSTSMDKMQVLFTPQFETYYSSDIPDRVSYGEESAIQICNVEVVPDDDTDFSVATRSILY